MAKAILIAVTHETQIVMVWTRSGLKPADRVLGHAEIMLDEAAHFAKSRLEEVDARNAAVTKGLPQLRYHVIPLEDTHGGG